MSHEMCVEFHLVTSISISLSDLKPPLGVSGILYREDAVCPKHMRRERGKMQGPHYANIQNSIASIAVTKVTAPQPKRKPTSMLLLTKPAAVPKTM